MISLTESKIQHSKWQKHRIFKQIFGVVLLTGLSSVYSQVQPVSACPLNYSFWNDSTQPGKAFELDNNAVELGLRFRSNVDGEISAIRFYRAVAIDSGYKVNLWSATGQLLGSGIAVEGQGPTPGWQTVQLYPPVAIKANQFYVASYYASRGTYSVSENFFTNTTVNSGPLSALRDGEDGSTGVYTYSIGGGFPTLSYNGSNYWVDVVFKPNSSTQ
ncbi:DUF4082 domain-containing protein [Nostocaceae cyanobacterium CENA369]|uniref:DUF4082 domain-containing protein n=1 Tax=Dendronalium phyllosphericum CENA369 TaxID=1725256 RepID=A0A8J7LDM6_9NOST|nr:DUF4082 domain-containing protein [Dendronalium phyllosphericum]MBH8571834.1 DUF4082 domain-containing protein [Dendronalium phyllosphericum CENA369]